jgi:hypothetical protein
MLLVTRMRQIGGALVLGGCVVAAGGCSHVANLTPPAGSSPTPSGSQSPGSSPTPTSNPSASPSGLCTITTRDPNATIVVSIDPDFAAANTSYGTVFGYAQFDPTVDPTLPPSASAIAAKTSDLVVFANYDPGLIAHSATGFLGVSAFPGEPYPFPSADASPVATTISSGAWSTGSLASFGNTSSTICYSQTFSLPTTGTFYFGDDPLYNSPSSFRGVIVVSQ